MIVIGAGAIIAWLEGTDRALAQRLDEQVKSATQATSQAKEGAAAALAAKRQALTSKDEVEAATNLTAAKKATTSVSNAEA